MGAKKMGKTGSMDDDLAAFGKQAPPTAEALAQLQVAQQMKSDEALARPSARKVPRPDNSNFPECLVQK